MPIIFPINSLLPILSQTAKQTSQLHPMAEMKACSGVSCSLACAIETVFAKKAPSVNPTT